MGNMVPHCSRILFLLCCHKIFASLELEYRGTIPGLDGGFGQIDLVPGGKHSFVHRSTCCWRSHESFSDHAFWV